MLLIKTKCMNTMNFKQLGVNHYFRFVALYAIGDMDYPPVFKKVSKGKIRQYGKKEEERFAKDSLVIDLGQELPLEYLESLENK